MGVSYTSRGFVGSVSGASTQRARIYAFHIFIVNRVCTIRVSTFPSRNHPVPRRAPNSRARVSARSQEPVPLRNIQTEPASQDNLAIRAKTATHKGKPLVSSPRVPLPRDISTSGSRIQETVPPPHEPVPPSREYPTPPRVNKTPTNIQG